MKYLTFFSKKSIGTLHSAKKVVQSHLHHRTRIESQLLHFMVRLSRLFVDVLTPPSFEFDRSPYKIFVNIHTKYIEYFEKNRICEAYDYIYFLFFKSKR